MPRRKPRIQKEFIWRGQGYDCKWDFTSNTKLTFILLAFIFLFLTLEFSFQSCILLPGISKLNFQIPFQHQFSRSYFPKSRIYKFPTFSFRKYNFVRFLNLRFLELRIYNFKILCFLFLTPPLEFLIPWLVIPWRNQDNDAKKIESSTSKKM